MTSSHTPDRPAAAGVFVVRDPDVCAALEQLLAPHRTDPNGDASTAVDALMTAGENHARKLTGGAIATLPPGTTIEQLLDRVHHHAKAAGTEVGREAATAEGREQTEEMQERVRRAESAVAHAERDLDQTRTQLQDALAKIAESAARPQSRRPTVSALRLKDQKAWADLADRMDREAVSQPKTPAAVLRTASKSVRDEIAAIYGAGKKSA